MAVLVSKDAKNKVRIVHINYAHTSNGTYMIMRTTGQYGGKMTAQPVITIEEGKVNRTTEEQCILQFEHLIKEYKDKGYKQLEKDLKEYSEKELLEIVGKTITNIGGVPKPMLAKQADKVTNQKTFDKEYYASRKIDGLRVLIYLGTDNKLHTASRGGMNYDAAMMEILDHPKLIKLFKNNPSLILDGEAYHYGYSLQQINSVARTQKVATDYEFIQFYWYDIVITDKTFEQRWAIMQKIAQAMNIGWDPEKVFNDKELRIQLVPQIKVSGWDNMIKLHNDYVEEGWEGVVIRLTSALYKPNGRTNDMIKIKMYRDDCFKVVGYELGLRGSEDMVFIMQMEDGRTFKAKPWGDREQKEEYINNFDILCKNHIGECKFFYYSDDGMPLQPSFKAFRYDIE